MTIILPEVMDERIFIATEKILKEDIANIILIGKDEEIHHYSDKYDISKATIINPFTSNNTEKIIQEFVELRKSKGMTYDEAKTILLSDYMYYACMLVKLGMADGIVSEVHAKA